MLLKCARFGLNVQFSHTVGHIAKQRNEYWNLCILWFIMKRNSCAWICMYILAVDIFGSRSNCMRSIRLNLLEMGGKISNFMSLEVKLTLSAIFMINWVQLQCILPEYDQWCASVEFASSTMRNYLLFYYYWNIPRNCLIERVSISSEFHWNWNYANCARNDLNCGNSDMFRHLKLRFL